jgi:hypothetical protein
LTCLTRKDSGKEPEKKTAGKPNAKARRIATPKVN